MSQQAPEAEEHQPAGPAQDQPQQAEGREKLRALEAVLFMAADPLTREEIAEILEVTPREADGLARQLEAEYADRGIQVARIAGGYQVATRPAYGRYVARLHKPERFRLSRAALETLAIVAYRQPVTRPEIDSIRGVNSDSAVDTLVQYELICEAGRKEAPGRPVLYRTTEQFLGHFGLNSIEDLPQLDAIPAEIVVVEAGTAEAGERQEGAESPAGQALDGQADSGETQEQTTE